ncbi:MAG: glycosyltransferase [Mangrovicoccus sp.]
MLVAGLAVLVIRYLYWRLTVTVMPAEGFNAQSVLVWAIFIIELIAWTDATTLFMALLRRTDRSPEADIHEARLRRAEPEDLPSIDVFIATYDEPIEVLEKTIVGAISLDWPKDRLKIYVLDDSRRDWLRQYCEDVGVIHMTRDNNEHAKAGNINAAIKRTSGELFLVLDADFVPQQNFLYRAAGFFEDPKIGIVQIPHNFFNDDPMQANLRIAKSLPDDQRLFFDAIMPGRDGWDCSFCCGSNALTRRSAIEDVGGGLPTGSITEDMLLTLAMLRKGHVTRYLNERLAIGLAAESLSAFFVQRSRWARGAMQILYLKEGPLGPGLKWYQRLMFLPTHWLTQSLTQITAMVTPVIYLWTGLLPLLNTNVNTVTNYQLPAILGTMALMRILAPGQYHPLAATAHGVLQAFRLLPTVLATLVQPHGHAFKVTPKGGAGTDQVTADQFTVAVSQGLVMLTAAGLIINSDPNLRIVDGNSLIPVVAAWSIWNMVILSIVSTIAVAPPARRKEERFPLQEPCKIITEKGEFGAEIDDISLNGVKFLPESHLDQKVPERGMWVIVEIARVGKIPTMVHRHGYYGVAGEFLMLDEQIHRNLVARLFTEGIDNSTYNESLGDISWSLLMSILRRDRTPRLPSPDITAPPDWLIMELADESWSVENWIDESESPAQQDGQKAS